MATYITELVKLTGQEAEVICSNEMYEPINALLIDYVKQYTCVRHLNMAVCDISDFMSNKAAQLGISLGKNYFNGEFISVGSHGEGLGLLSNDRDTICINNKCSIVLPDQNTEPTEDDLLIDIANCHPGYCRLKFHRLNRRNVDTFGNEVKQIGREWYLKSSCIANRFKHGNELYDQWETHGPALSDDTAGQDFVLALKCRSSESLMEDYLSRERAWPDKEVLQLMKKSVSFTVVTAVHHKSIDTTIEYRFSYAQAERFLIRKLNANQFAVYVFLKQIKPSLEIGVSNTDVIRSYYIKTILLWVCESIPESEWNEQYFIRNCIWCLKILNLCYKYGILPSVFVPQNNLLDQFDKQTLAEAHSVINSYTGADIFLKNILGSLCGGSYEQFEHIFQSMRTRFTEATLRYTFKQNSTSSYPLDNIRFMIECETLSHIVVERNLNDPEIQVPVILEMIENLHILLKDYPVEYQNCIKTLFKRYLGDCVHTFSKSLRTYHAKCLTLFKESVDLCMPVSMRNDQGVSGTIHISLFHYLNRDLPKAREALFSVEQIIMRSDILSDMFYATDFTTREQLAADPFLLGLFPIFPNPAHHKKQVFFCLKIKYLAIAMYIMSKCRSITRRKAIQFKKKSMSYIACLRRTRPDAQYQETTEVLLKALSNFRVSLDFK